MKDIKIILTKNLNSSDININSSYSIECGLADGTRHFDHHGQFSSNPAPCNDPRIDQVKDGSRIYISHLDADCLIGLMRLLDIEIPSVLDYDLMEKVDLNGSSIIKGNLLDNETYLYMVGIGKLVRDMRFPRVTEEEQDVTDLVMKIIEKARDYKYIIKLGYDETKTSEENYKKTLVASNGLVGLWSIDHNTSFDPSRPYKDHYEVVVIYRKHYASISIYVNPRANHEFAGKEIASIKFAGHPKACGSPRGVEYSEDDARKVYEEIASEIYLKCQDCSWRLDEIDDKLTCSNCGACHG